MPESESESDSSESEAEESENSEEEAAPQPAACATKGKKKKDLCWKTGNWKTPEDSGIEEQPLKIDDSRNLSVNSSPIRFFELFCTDEFFESVVNESNFYNTQRSTTGYRHALKSKRQRLSFRKVKPVTVEEMKRFFQYHFIHGSP